MPLGARFTNLRRHLRLPPRTIRLRLTALYGGLFLVSGGVLLTIAYLWVLRTVPSGFFFTRSPDGAVLVGRSEIGASRDEPIPRPRLHMRAHELRAHAVEQRTTDLREFLTRSGIVLAVLTMMSTGLGWFVAGRVLRPLRAIAGTAREISAKNLDERLAFTGPVDELKELGDTIDGLLERLERAFRSQRQFVANASHELRTPLARQRTLIQVALSDPAASAESLRATHERVLLANHHQERLIESLLTLARSEAGLDRREPIEMSQAVEQVLVARHSEIAQRRLHLHVTLDRAPIAGDPRLVERLVVNLVDNAIRHNLVSGDIEVRTRTTDGNSVLQVANSGTLIPQSEVDRLFQPFQRLDASRSRTDEGLGLGLSIVQAIAIAHEATTTTRARSGGGLEITVVFPGTMSAARR